MTIIHCTLACLVIGFCLIEVGSSCSCGCGFSPYAYGRKGSISAMVVRPVELPKIPLALAKSKFFMQEAAPLLKALKPIGGLCSCKTTICSPAVPAKPPLYFGGLRGDMNMKMLQKMMMMQSGLLPSGLAPPAPAPADPVPVPTDPVSLQLALKAEQQLANAMEDRLAFGFRSIPKEVPEETIASFQKFDVAEENLYALNGDIVALKPPALVAPVKSVDEEAEETLMDALKEQKLIGALKKPTLGQLGFAPALIKPPPTKTITASAASAAAAGAAAAAAFSSSSCLTAPGAPSFACNDGSIPGQVFQGSVPKVEKYLFPAPPLPPCSDAEDSALLPVLPPQPQQLPPTGSYSVSASAAAAVAGQASFRYAAGLGC